MGKNELNEASEGRAWVTTMQARKACCDWTASHGKWLMCGRFANWARSLWNPFCFPSYLVKSPHISLLRCVISMVGDVGEGAFCHSFWWGHGLDGKNTFHHGFDLIKTTVSIFN